MPFPVREQTMVKHNSTDIFQIQAVLVYDELCCITLHMYLSPKLQHLTRMQPESRNTVTLHYVQIEKWTLKYKLL